MGGRDIKHLSALLQPLARTGTDAVSVLRHIRRVPLGLLGRYGAMKALRALLQLLPRRGPSPRALWLFASTRKLPLYVFPLSPPLCIIGGVPSLLKFLPRERDA